MVPQLFSGKICHSMLRALCSIFNVSLFLSLFNDAF